MCLFEPVAPSTRAREGIWLLHYPKLQGHTARGASMLRDTDTFLRFFFFFFFLFSLLTLFQGLGFPPAANRLWRHYIWNMKISGLWEKMSRREKQAGRKVSLPWKPPHKGRWDVTQLLFSLFHFAPKGSFSSLCVLNWILSLNVFWAPKKRNNKKILMDGILSILGAGWTFRHRFEGKQFISDMDYQRIAYMWFVQGGGQYLTYTGSISFVCCCLLYSGKK